MNESGPSRLHEILQTQKTEILADWMAAQRATGVERSDLMSEAELGQESAEFLRLLTRASEAGDITTLRGDAWDPVRDFLSGIARSRGLQGFTPRDVAMFVFSLKQPLFARIRQTYGTDSDGLFREIWDATALLDQLGYLTTEVFQRTREEVISRQQQDMLELSTPVVKLWDGILALPMIGTLDSARTQVVMETLLQRIVETECEIAIIDITGVPTVDTLVAQHLLKTVAAARLMGADCIISGIRPQIAQTIVHLGVDLSAVMTKATLADAFKLALERNGRTVTRVPRKA